LQNQTVKKRYIMKRTQIIYWIFLCLALFHISCKKEEAVTANDLTPDNTVYAATAKFTKEYYLNSPYYTDSTATIAINIIDPNKNTPIPDGESLQLLLFSDSKLTDLLSKDTLITQQGNINSTIHLKQMPTGILTVYMQIVFANNTLLSGIVASSYKVPEFHNFTNLYPSALELSSPNLVYPLFTSQIPFTLTGLSLPAGTYNLDFLLVKTTSTNKKTITITVDSEGKSSFFISFDIFRGGFYLKIAIPYQENYIWADSPLIKIYNI